MMKKSGQGWGFDLIVAMLIFLFGIMAFFVYSLNYDTGTEDNFKLMAYDGEVISDSLLSEGFPTNWNTTNVIVIGLTSDNKINETKLQNLYILNETNYDKTRALFDTGFNYYFNFSEPIMFGSNYVVGIGKIPINQKDLIKTTRFTIYKNKPVSLYLYIWR
jgi:hypothetical protein